EDRNRADHRSLSSEGRYEQGSRPEFHSARWLPALPELQRRGSWRRCPREEVEEEISHKRHKKRKRNRSLPFVLFLPFVANLFSEARRSTSAVSEPAARTLRPRLSRSAALP